MQAAAVMHPPAFYLVKRKNNRNISTFYPKYLVVNRNITTFAVSNNNNQKMKSSELHRRFIKAGWVFDHAEGSHYFYKKDGVLSEPIPYHGSKEMYQPLANKLIRKYGV